MERSCARYSIACRQREGRCGEGGPCPENGQRRHRKPVSAPSQQPEAGGEEGDADDENENENENDENDDDEIPEEREGETSYEDEDE